MTTTIDPDTPPPGEAPGPSGHGPKAGGHDTGAGGHGPEAGGHGTPAGPPRLPRWGLAAFVIGGALFLLIAVAALVVGSNGDGGSPTAADWTGRLIDPAPERPEFVLTDADGNAFDFRARTDGTLTLVYFGYTNCVDVCPVQLATLSAALEKVQVPAQVVFVTTDPARDTPERLKSWLAAFPHPIIGLTGDPAQIEAAQRAVGATVAIVEPADASGNYEVGHTSGVFVMTPDDRVHLAYPFGTRQEDWVDELPRIAKTKAWQATEPRAATS